MRRFVTITGSRPPEAGISNRPNLAVVLTNMDFMKNRNILIKEIDTEDSKLVLRRTATADAVKLTRENATRPLNVESRGGFYRTRNGCLPTHARQSSSRCNLTHRTARSLGVGNLYRPPRSTRTQPFGS